MHMPEKKDSHYKIDCDNLAVPEIHTGKLPKEDSTRQKKESITYDTVAIPEIHIRK